jgi:peptide/nickel transport system substrate-binding protein
MARNRTLIAAVWALALLVATACSGTPAGDSGAGPAPEGGEQAAPDDREAEQGGEMVVALSEEPDALDPSLASTFVGRIVFANMCEALYDTNADLEVVPQLAAELPEVSEDGLTVTIPIREGVTFNDGTPLDAEAVVTTLERHQSLEGSSRTSDLAPVVGIEVVDPMTVQLTLDQPFAPLTSILADRAGMIMSPAQLEELGENFADEPVCVGPFQFVERRAGDAIVLERAEEYYDADQVKLDQLTFSIISQGPVRAANLRSGDVHMAERLDTTSLAEIESDPNLALYQATSIGFQDITINLGNVAGVSEPFGEHDSVLASDPRIREAFELSLDREGINQVVFEGRFQPGCSPLAPESPFYPADLDCGERDVEAAQALLAEAGVQTPVPVPLNIPTDPISIRLGQVIQTMASEAGFDVQVQPTEFVTGLELADEGNFDATQGGWSGRIDPDGNMFSHHHSTGSRNRAGASDPEIDELLEAGRTTTDEAERREIYADAIDAVRERRNIVYLYHQTLFTGADADLVGFELSGDGLLRLKTAGFAAE